MQTHRLTKKIVGIVLIGAVVLAGSLQINEIMTSNGTTYADPQGFGKFLQGMEETLVPALKSVGLYKPLE